jgi:Protein of unknown function (DUF3015)
MNVSPPEGLAMQDKKYSPWIEDKEGRLMKTSLFKSLGFGLVVGGLALAVSACNTTKATYDTLVKFSSSTSPGELFTGDGLVKKNQKVNLYTAIVLENLQQDMARGSGEYLASLSVLLDIPPDRQHEWGLFTQSQYSFLFPSERATSSELLARLGRELAANPRTSERIGE